MPYLRAILLDHVDDEAPPVTVSVCAEPSQDSRLFLNFASPYDSPLSVFLEPGGAMGVAGAISAAFRHPVDLAFPADPAFPALGADAQTHMLIVSTSPEWWGRYREGQQRTHYLFFAPQTDRVEHACFCSIDDAIELHNAIADGHNYLAG